MDKKFSFTQARIRDLPIPKTGRVDYYDLKVPKLTCRVSSTGNKSFVVVKWDGKTTQRVTLGKFPDMSVLEAQGKAQSTLATINAGVNPIEQKRKNLAAQTALKDVLEQYIASRTLKANTVRDYRYKLKLGFPDWLDKPVNAITESMVLKRHKSISQKHKTTANTTMRVLRLTLNFAEAIGMVDKNPTKVLSKARAWNKNNRKQRIIPSKQLTDWYNAVVNLSNRKACVYLLMLLYMGFRCNEALLLEWRQVDLGEKKIHLFDTKNGTDHILPIPEPLLPHIQELKSITGHAKWAFPGVDESKPMSIPTKPMREVTRVSGVQFSPHDCRRTFSTIAEAISIPMSMIKRLLNHVTTNDVTGGYIVTEEDTLRQAINKIADFIVNKVNEGEHHAENQSH